MAYKDMRAEETRIIDQAELTNMLIEAQEHVNADEHMAKIKRLHAEKIAERKIRQEQKMEHIIEDDTTVYANLDEERQAKSLGCLARYFPFLISAPTEEEAALKEDLLSDDEDHEDAKHLLGGKAPMSAWASTGQLERPETPEEDDWVKKTKSVFMTESQMSEQEELETAQEAEKEEWAELQSWELCVDTITASLTDSADHELMLGSEEDMPMEQNTTNIGALVSMTWDAISMTMTCFNEEVKWGLTKTQETVTQVQP
jgi:hypothetical protein